MKIIQQGDPYPTGGRFVGIAPSGVVWVCYGDHEQFARMAMAFGSVYVKQMEAKKS